MNNTTPLYINSPKDQSRWKTLFGFRWQPSRWTWLAALLTVLVFLSSAAILPFEGRSAHPAAVILSTFLMRLVLGVAVPLWFVLVLQGGKLADLGITRRRLPLMLGISLVLAVLQGLLFSQEAGIPLQFNGNQIPALAFILVSGIFELVFFYGYLQGEFEKAFGLIPSILLAALAYSAHHIGFQPGAYMELFFVGILYIGIFRAAGRNAFVLYPFAWGVGACWDVLLDDQISSPSFRWWVALTLLGLTLAAFWFFHRRSGSKG